ncbi:MAG: deoxyhypusine synthase [Candidatus Methanofastidiosa archaeon]|jgi:deoxyhypusine synthase|nr:deoxyhypusine synthase [Candidatus Methanofastidiosa archaeon]HOM95674.1 deoxyhypusine synthase [Methanofastidiosum sp.]HPC80905.1 deoxyhypusine synthase [Methanofastidiosum sp.]HRS26075.1 deoxyhypusine synthase [Methanofastidiosum sp.]
MKREVVKDIDLGSIKSMKDLTYQMTLSGGYVAKKVGDGSKILENMVKDKECKRILSFPASLVATGTRGIIKDLLKKKIFDMVITTTGTLDHDIARIYGNYYQGSFEMDDRELHKEGINREGNVLIPNESYSEILEDKVRCLVEELYHKGVRDISTHELIWEFGKSLEVEKNKEDSIVYWCYKSKIPVILPGPLDGSWGWQLYYFWQDGHKDFNVNIMKDEDLISDFIYSSDKSGALMIGGGISKHHTIWWNQFRGGLDYAVYITTAPEWDGSLSGARIREAISWGKVRKDAEFITIEGDATVILPLMIGSLFENLK